LPNRDVVVIGASAGGIEALQYLCSRLPANLNASIMLVLHTSPHSNGLLPRVLSRAGKVPAANPSDGERIEKNRIYVARPDYHLLVDRGYLRVIQGPRENHNRPAIDPLFRSAAVAYGPRVIGVVLTGLLDDGTSGLMVVRRYGGTAIVQDPRTAMFPAMPTSALERVPDAYVEPLEKIPALLVKLIAEQVDDVPPPRDPLAESETRIAEMDMSEIDSDVHNGRSSQFAWPECGGVLWEVDQEGLLRFRCRVGHAYTARHLDSEQRHAIEASLWAALRALEESASLYRRMAERADNSHHHQTRDTYQQRAEETSDKARTLRDFLLEVSAAEPKSGQLSDLPPAERRPA
jgi:two-component system chemotaxis response regulator CheB